MSNTRNISALLWKKVGIRLIGVIVAAKYRFLSYLRIAGLFNNKRHIAGTTSWIKTYTPATTSASTTRGATLAPWLVFFNYWTTLDTTIQMWGRKQLNLCAVHAHNEQLNSFSLASFVLQGFAPSFRISFRRISKSFRYEKHLEMIVDYYLARLHLCYTQL